MITQIKYKTKAEFEQHNLTVSSLKLLQKKEMTNQHHRFIPRILVCGIEKRSQESRDYKLISNL